MSYVPELDGRQYVLALKQDGDCFLLFEERELIIIHKVMLVRNKALADKIGALLNVVGDRFGHNDNFRRK
ncbi:hypothetical protein KY312_00270 [Candidatus Woesearchaeota archaeon]|nr:hypothetical protein [Candidatus Woesearchaeota archaeon]